MDESQTESSVESTESTSTGGSEGQVAASSSNEGAGTNADASSAQKDEHANVPFHMHPRFQEVVNQRNEFKAQLAESQRNYEKQLYEMKMQMQQFQTRLPEQKPQQHPVFDKLKDIDQDFAAYLRGLEEKVEKIAKYEEKFGKYDERFNSMDSRTVEQQAEQTLDGLYKQHQVPEYMKDLVRSRIEAAVWKDQAAGKQLSLNDLPNYFKNAFDGTKKIFDEFGRSQLQNYVVDKKKDVVPASQTGGAPVANVPKTPKVMNKSDLASMVAKEIRAAKQNI